MSEGNFECQISGRRESSSGIFITLQVNPADVTADLAMLRVGETLMIGWAQILDATVHKIEVKTAPNENKKERRKFEELPLSQQAALRCNDKQFIDFLSTQYHILEDYFEPSEAIRHFCEVSSRKEFDTDDIASGKWRAMDANFQNWLTDQRYASVKR